MPDVYGHGNNNPMAKCPEFYWLGGDEAADILCRIAETHRS